MKNKSGGPIKEDTAQTLKARWRDVQVVIDDEFSMQSAEDILEIDRRLKVAKSSKEDFGGLHILFGGDFYQVDPIKKYTHTDLCTKVD